MRGLRLRRILGVAVVAPTLALSLAQAADAVKLKPLGSIYIDMEGKGLREPEDVGCGKGEIVVADTSNGRLVVYDVTDDGARPRAAIVVPQVPLPIRVAVLPGGELLALDGRARRIARLSAAGEFEGFLEFPASDGRHVEPRSVAVGPDARIFVLDVGGERILVASSTGEVERVVAIPAEVGFVSDLAVDERGTIYAVDSVRRRVYVAGPGDETLVPLTEPLTEDVDFPTAIAVDAEGRIFVADSHGGGVVILDRSGSFRGRQLSMGWKEGTTRYPTGVCVDGQNRLFLAERGNSRVQMFLVR